MIIRADDELMKAALGTPGRRAGRQDLSWLSDLIPQWMSEALAENSILVLSRDDYVDLPDEVRQRVSILSP